MLTPALLARAYGFLGGFEALAAMSAFFFVLPQSGYAAATTACLAAIIVMQLVNVHLCRSNRTSTFTSVRQWNVLIVVGMAVELLLMLLIAYTPIGQAVFATAPINIDVWLFVVPFAVAMFAAEELRKWVVRTSHRRHQRLGPPSPVAK